MLIDVLGNHRLCSLTICHLQYLPFTNLCALVE